MADPRPTVGVSVPRVDAVAKVTGSATYAIDTVLPDMLHGRVVRADRPHARVIRVSAQAALRVPGCVAVVTGQDLAPLFPRFGHIIPDHQILAVDKVRYFGEPVALVIATDPRVATDACEEVEVEYEDLPAALDPDQALAPDAPLLHEQRYAGESVTPIDAGSDGGSHGNVAHQAECSWGDPDRAFAGADAVVETRAHYPMLYAYAMEPYNATARFVEGTLEVVSTAQHPFMVARDLARVFGLPHSKVRVAVPYIGGGYGSKSYTKIEPLAAVGAWHTGRPVKVVLDVEESIYTTRSDDASVVVRTAFDADGTMTAREVDITFDTGAYADNSPNILQKAVNRCFGPYRVPHLRVRGRAMYTNTAPASSYRGLGAFQVNLACETNIDQAAERLGIDPCDLRRRNLVRRGETLIPGLRPMDADLPADLDALVSRLDAGDTTGRHLLRGVGFGCSASDAGALPSSTAQVKLASDGSAVVLSGSAEMGQGSKTALTQVTAQELGIGLDRLSIVQSDTAVTPFERSTGASRTTTLAGLAVQRACRDALDKLRAMAAEIWQARVDDVRAEPGRIVNVDGRALDFGEVVLGWFGAAGGEVVGVGVVRRAGELAQLPPFWEIGMTGVALTVDAETGEVTVDQLVTVADVGRAIHPANLEGQDLGAATQGLGGALSEELVYDGPQIVNANMVEYRVPRIGDAPRRFDSIIAERGDGVGPYGAKGAGEGARNPIGGAVAAAVARAVGVWPDRLPLTPERVWRLLLTQASPGSEEATVSVDRGQR
ncbi:MAG: xanthine dehydrogenase family protein molybdopterin-binding subunit [Nocardioidaceae bacterium]